MNVPTELSTNLEKAPTRDVDLGVGGDRVWIIIRQCGCGRRREKNVAKYILYCVRHKVLVIR